MRDKAGVRHFFSWPGVGQTKRDENNGENMPRKEPNKLRINKNKINKLKFTVELIGSG